jgi:hypothetical protein
LFSSKTGEVVESGEGDGSGGGELIGGGVEVGGDDVARDLQLGLGRGRPGSHREDAAGEQGRNRNAKMPKERVHAGEDPQKTMVPLSFY